MSDIENIIIDTDSYKASHFLQYPEKTSSMFSYVESRTGGDYSYTVFFGLQYYLKKYLTHRITVAEVEEAKEFFEAHGEPFNYDGWMYIATELGGKIPVKIRSVPEGSIVPTGNVLVTVESTDPRVFWVASWLETSLLRSIWYPTTVATRSYFIKQIILEALRISSDDPEAEIDFKLHDFGSRGVSSQESAMIGGAAHLINFQGSDTVVGVRCANKYYHHKMSAVSLPASEHSTITSWGKEHEVDAYRNMLKQFAKPGALVAVVSDSYDLWYACSKLWGEELKEEVINSGATIIIRPDTGNPPSVVLKTAQILEEKFGVTINKRGYKVLNHVRIIQGDGIHQDSTREILNILMDHGYSVTNICFGMGGQLLQALNRDTLRFAMKCSHIYRDIDGRYVSVDVCKSPVTDHNKNSKPGRLDLIRHEDGRYETVSLSLLKEGDVSDWYKSYLEEFSTKMVFDYNVKSVMRTVYENGEIFIEEDLETIRVRTKSEKVINA